MSIYRVEKSELPVVVFQADGSVMKGVVFLSASAYSHMGQQTLLDLMKEPGDFFPFRTESGAFCVTNKKTITHIRFDPSEETSAYESLGDREDVDIKFAGGEKLSGTITIEMPEGRNRLFDFVNAINGFFLLQNQEAYYLVNMSQIRDVSPQR
ncbi:MAG: hypothetical protein DRH08_06940 [Deltaproteobacteria bacterium]|nr:MAG: hypothetical protein DRH08_06940 [Deltaproteobacteria bacterium]